MSAEAERALPAGACAACLGTGSMYQGDPDGDEVLCEDCAGTGESETAGRIQGLTEENERLRGENQMLRSRP